MTPYNPHPRVEQYTTVHSNNKQRHQTTAQVCLYHACCCSSQVSVCWLNPFRTLPKWRDEGQSASCQMLASPRSIPPLTSHLCPRLPLTSSRLSEHFIMPCSQRSTSFGLCDPCTVLRSLSFYSYLSLPPSMNWNTFNDAWNTEMRKNKILFFTFSQWTNWIPLSDILFCMIRSELLQNEEGAIAKDFKNSRNQALWHEISRTMTYHLYNIGDF